MCLWGYGVVRDLFEQRDLARIRGLVLWLPMLGGDDDVLASQQAQKLRDSRVQHYWDHQRHVSQELGRVLGRESPTWDVYLLYQSGVPWGMEKPPTPNFWMHQLEGPGADPALRLGPDPSRLSRELDRLTAGGVHNGD